MTALMADLDSSDVDPADLDVDPVEQFFDGPTILEEVPRIWETGDWPAQARCRSRDVPYEFTEAFFPRRGDGASIARRICGPCPVRQPCLDFALAFPSVQGVWGGKTEAERTEMTTARLAAERVAAHQGPFVWA